MRCRARIWIAVLACMILALTSPAGRAWESALYDSSWMSPGSGFFETDKLIQDFSYAGYRRGEEPLPQVAGPVFNASVTYGADATGTVDSTVAIQNAIDAAAAAGGGVVYLPAGTYLVKPQGTNTYSLRVTASNIVIRGDGPGVTFVVNDSHDMRAKSVIRVEATGPAAWTTETALSTPVATDLTGPTSDIPVADVSGFQVGDWVVVRGDVTTAWINEHNEPDWLGFESQLGSFLYYRKITAIDVPGNVLTIDVPTRYYLKTRDGARVYAKPGNLEEVGIEELSIGNRQHPGVSGWDSLDYENPAKSAYEVHASRLIELKRVRDSWIRNVDTFQPAGNTSTCHSLSNVMRLFECRGVTVQDCHFQRPQYGGGGGNGYMITITNCNECLLEDCIAEYSRHGFSITNMASSGNVLLRCRDKDTGNSTGSTGSMPTAGRGSDHHQKFSHSNLIDTCIADNSYWEARYRPFGTVPLHNLTAAHSVFWNTEGLSSPVAYVVHSQQCRYGYVIGTRGAVTAVETGGTSTAKTDPADHVEGAGLGATLSPFSLFEDQRLKRLLLPGVDAGANLALNAPENTVSLSAVVTFGGVPNPGVSATMAWSVDSGPGGVLFGAPDQIATTATFGAPGNYVLRIEVTKGAFSASDTMTVIVLPFSELIAGVLPEADSNVQNGAANVNTNFGSSTVLRMKNVGSVNVEREIFMRYDVGSFSGATILSAVMELHATQPDVDCNARTRRVVDDSWQENTITWNTKPPATTVLLDWVPDPSLRTVLDLTGEVQSESLGDGKMSLQHRVESQVSSGTVFTFGSKDGAAPARPLLAVHYKVPVLSYGSWIAGFATVPVGERGALDDPDGDLRTNLAELIHGSDPGAADGVSPVSVGEDGSGHFLAFEQRKALPPEVYYVVEDSSDLSAGSWGVLPGVVFETVQDLGATIEVRARVPEVVGGTRHYYRLRYVLY